MSQPGRLIARGRTSNVYEFGTEVVKVPRSDVPAHWAQVEAEHAEAVHAAGLPVPQVLDVVCVYGRDAIVFERVHGPSMWQSMVADPDRAPYLARQMASVHLHIHSVAAPRTLPQLHSRIAENIAGVEAVSACERSDALDLADQLPRGDRLCHGDLHPGNILMSHRGPVVIDWFDAASGDRFADIVRTSLLLRPPGHEPIRMQHLPGASRSLLESIHLAYLKRMFSVVAPDTALVQRWEAVLAVSRLAEKAESSELDLVALWQAGQTTNAESTPLLDALRLLAAG